MQSISRDEVKLKLDSGDAVLVETLPEDSYQNFHLPGAINVPPGEDFDERIQQAVPDKSQDVIVYCMDSECGASPKAARTMDDLGYEHVYDYEAGKVDWKEAGLPVES